MKIDLQGKWLVWLDAAKTGVHPVGMPETIRLPGTTSYAGIGPENPERAVGYLTDAHKFEGHAWFERTFVLPEEAAGLPLLLTLERTRKTTVYLDGREIGSQSSLCTPHRYRLDGAAPGEHDGLLVRRAVFRDRDGEHGEHGQRQNGADHDPEDLQSFFHVIQPLSGWIW